MANQKLNLNKNWQKYSVQEFEVLAQLASQNPGAAVEIMRASGIADEDTADGLVNALARAERETNFRAKARAMLGVADELTAKIGLYITKVRGIQPDVRRDAYRQAGISYLESL